MNTPRDAWQGQLAALPLPETAHTKNGVPFDPREDWWRIRDGNHKASLNFSRLPPVTPAFLKGFKQALVARLERVSARSVESDFTNTLAVIRHATEHRDQAIDALRFEDLSRYAQSSPKAYKGLSRCKSFLQRWAMTGWHGMAPDLATVFPDCKQSSPGQAVATQDTRKGPYDDQEFDTLLMGIHDGLEMGLIELDRALELRLIAILGVRPEQLAQAKCVDIQKDEFGRAVINVPMVKGKNKAARTEFRRFVMEPTTGEALWDYMQAVMKHFAHLLKNPKEAPLFPAVRQDEAVDTGAEFAYHSTSLALSGRIATTLQRLQRGLPMASVRLNGETIPASALRFRRSFAQRGADEGIDIFTLAHLMCHRNTNNVKVYFTVTDRIRARFSKKIAEQMAPLAAVFGKQMRILKDLSEASRPTQGSIIPDLRLDQHGRLKNLASCASCGECRQWRPYACLAGCPSFEPFLDADLEPILDRMLAEREQGVETDETIARIRDRAIYGCAQVILRQRDLRQQDEAQ